MDQDISEAYIMSQKKSINRADLSVESNLDRVTGSYFDWDGNELPLPIIEEAKSYGQKSGLPNNFIGAYLYASCDPHVIGSSIEDKIKSYQIWQNEISEENKRDSEKLLFYRGK